MRKVNKVIGIIAAVLCLLAAYHLFHFDNRYLIGNATYEQYKATTDYERKYPVENYVDERMNASAILRSGVIGSMVHYDEIVASEGSKIKTIGILWNVFWERNTYMDMTQQLQYIETKPIRIEYVGEKGDHNFQYIGYLEDGTEVRGNLAIWGSVDAVSTAISFQDGKGNIDVNKARLLTDDSNAEMLAYLLIESTQMFFGTEYEPNEAALKFFNCTLENVAGSIAYHAAASYEASQNGIGELSFDKVKTANISTIDEDGYFVNQSY